MGSPFDSGKTLVFKSMSPGARCYLDGWPDQEKVTVYLSQSLDFATNLGCHWEAKKIADGIYTFKTLSACDNKPCYLADLGPSTIVGGDPSLIGNPTLSDDATKTNCHWRANKLDDGGYSFQCLLTHRYLNSNPESEDYKHTVSFAISTAFPGTHWKVGVDSYIGSEIKAIINKIYPDLNVAFYLADMNYMAMDMDRMHKIWVGSRLGDYKWTKEKFDCDDFSVCMKAQVAKYSYNQLVGKGGCLCGIMWGSTDKSAHAFNFTIDPFQNLLLFEPQNGQEIGTHAWNPYFCLI